MTDQERANNAMNLAFELLENIIRELPVTIARQDELSMYAQQLMDAAYAAGKLHPAGRESNKTQ
jgi:hypothetical protein